MRGATCRTERSSKQSFLPLQIARASHCYISRPVSCIMQPASEVCVSPLNHPFATVVIGLFRRRCIDNLSFSPPPPTRLLLRLASLKRNANVHRETIGLLSAGSDSSRFPSDCLLRLRYTSSPTAGDGRTLSKS